MDTSDFLKGLRDITVVPTEGWLVTVDVVSLYTSIEHQKGIEAVRGLLSTGDYSVQQQNFVMELLEIVLYENFVLFRDQFFIQKRGTAMGSNVAPHMQIVTCQILRNALFTLIHCIVNMP